MARPPARKKTMGPIKAVVILLGMCVLAGMMLEDAITGPSTSSAAVVTTVDVTPSTVLYGAQVGADLARPTITHTAQPCQPGLIKGQAVTLCPSAPPAPRVATGRHK